MDIENINRKINSLHIDKLEYGSLQIDSGAELPIVVSTKTKLPLCCKKCGAKCYTPSQYRSLDNLRAIKKGHLGTGCVICKTIAETLEVCGLFLKNNDIGMSFVVESFDVSSLRVRLFDAKSKLEFGKTIRHTEIRNIAYGNRELCYSNELEMVRADVAPLLKEFKANFPSADVCYLGYYRTTQTRARLKFFNISIPAKCLYRHPQGIRLDEVPSSELRKIIKQQKTDEGTVLTFKEECVAHNGTYLRCLGRQSNIDPTHKRGSALYFEYKTQTGDIKRNTLAKARECNFQQTARTGERLVLAIMRGLYPQGEWLSNTRPWWNTAPMFGQEDKQVRLEIDILSVLLKIAVERQSKWHTEVVDPKRCPTQVDRYSFYDPIKRKNAKKAGYSFIEIESPEVDSKVLLAEVEEKLGIKATPEQLERIEQEVNFTKQYGYRQYREEFLNVLSEAGCSIGSHYNDALLSPNDEVTIKMACGHININTVGYFKQGNGLYGCRECISKDNALRQQVERKEKIKKGLGEVWNRLSVDIQKQLIASTLKDKITCPYCQTKLTIGITINELIDNLIKNDGFYCIHCHNTGTPLTNDPHLAGNVYQWKEKIMEVISRTGWGSPEKWYAYTNILEDTASGESSEGRIVVTLTCLKGHEQSKTLNRWSKTFGSVKRKENKQYCDKCYPLPPGKTYDEDVHIQRMRIFHPNASFVDGLESKGLVPFQCNEVTVIGMHTIEHPAYYESLNKLFQKSEKNSPSTFAYCLCCAVTEGKTTPGNKKRIEHLLARLKLRAAYIADRLELESIESVSIKSKVDNRTEGEISSSDKIIIQCHEVNHSPFESTPNNLFSPYKKGYCPQCLKDIGVKNFRDICNIY